MRASLVAAAVLFQLGGAQAQVPAPPQPDVAFGRSIAIIRADVATGDELARRRDWDVAHRHFMFPLEEVYGVIRGDLKTYKTPPFDAALRTLARTAATRNLKQYPIALQNVEAALATAEAGLKARQAKWPAFVVQVAVAVLVTAPDEYDDAVEDGHIKRPISYQVARGYVFEADRMIESVAGELAAENATALGVMRDNLSVLKKAFAAVHAPKPPPLDVSAMRQTVAEVAAAATAVKPGI